MPTLTPEEFKLKFPNAKTIGQSQTSSRVRTIPTPATDETELTPTERGAERAEGAVKGALSTGLGIGTVLQGAGQRILAGIDPTKTLEEIRGGTGFKTLEKGTEESIRAQEFVEPEGRLQRQGFVAEQLGELVAPIGVGKLATKVDDLVKLATADNFATLSKLLGFGTKSAISAGEFAGKTAAQTGGDIEEVERAAKIGALGPTLGKATALVADKTLRFMSILTGKGSDIVKQALSNPKLEDEGINRGDEALREVVLQGQKASEGIYRSFLKGHGLAMDQVLGKQAQSLISRNKIKSLFNNILQGEVVI